MTHQDEIAAINAALLSGTLHLAENGLAVAEEPDHDAHVGCWLARSRRAEVPGFTAALHRMYPLLELFEGMPDDGPSEQSRVLDNVGIIANMPTAEAAYREAHSQEARRQAFLASIRETATAHLDHNAHVKAFEKPMPSKYPSMGLDRRTGALVPLRLHA